MRRRPQPGSLRSLLDVRDPGCPPDPFENDAKYPRKNRRARQEYSAGSYYGYGSGIVGLRLFRIRL